MRYGMIDTLRQQYPVALMCRVLDVSESGFHAWNIRPPCEREQKNARLVIEILAAQQRTRETYSVKRLHSELVGQGVQITAYRVRVLRKKLNLRCKQKRKFKVTTYSKHHLSRPGFTGDSIRRFEAFSCKVAPGAYPHLLRSTHRHCLRNTLCLWHTKSDASFSEKLKAMSAKAASSFTLMKAALRTTCHARMAMRQWVNAPMA